MKDYKDLIVSYIKGELSEKEVVLFEKELERNLELQEEVQFERTLFYSAQKNNYSNFLKETLDEQDLTNLASSTKPRGKVIPLKTKFGWIVGIAAMLILISTVLLFNNSEMNRVYAETVDKYLFPIDEANQFLGPGEDSLNVTSNLKISEFKRAFNKKEIEQEEIEKAQVLLNSGDLTPNEQLELQFEVAMAQMVMGQMDRAHLSVERYRELLVLSDAAGGTERICAADYLENLITVKELKNSIKSIEYLEANTIECEKLGDYQKELVKDLKKLND